MFAINNIEGIERQEQMIEGNHIILFLLIKPSDIDAEKYFRQYHYLNCKSDKYCSIYLIGYSDRFDDNRYSDAVTVGEINLGNEIQYSDTCFIDACDNMKKRLKHWSYSGEPELIVLQNSSVDNPRSQLDFSNYVYIDINYGIEKGYLDSFPRFIERLLEAAKQEVTAKDAVTSANRKRMKARNIIEFALEQDEKLPKPLKKVLADKTFYKSYRG